MCDASGTLASSLLAQQLLALVDIHIDETLPERGELDVGLFEVHELEDLQRFAEREEVVDLEAEQVRQMGQVRLAVVGRRGDLFEHAGQRVGRHVGQGKGEPCGCRLRHPGGLGPLGHQRVDLVDQVRGTADRAGRAAAGS